MAIETENHAGKRDLEKTLSTEKLKQYDNGQGGALSIDINNLMKIKDRGASLSDEKAYISEECAEFMNNYSLHRLSDDGSLDIDDMLINHLAPAFIEGGVV